LGERLPVVAGNGGLGALDELGNQSCRGVAALCLPTLSDYGIRFVWNASFLLRKFDAWARRFQKRST